MATSWGAALLLWPLKMTKRSDVPLFAANVTLRAILIAVCIAAGGTYLSGGVNLEVVAYAILLPALVASPTSYWMAHSIYVMTRMRDDIERIALTDDLSGLANRRGFFERAEKLITETSDPASHGALILIDIDNMKRINDSRGHKAGDAALTAVGRVIGELTPRDSGVAGRIGGEEFAIFITRLLADSGKDVAESICERIRQTPIRSDDDNFHVTSSCGVTTISGSETIKSAFLRADGALYAAKNAGRDRVVSGDPDLTAA